MIETFAVGFIAVVAALAGLMVVLTRTAVHSALFLVLNFFCLSFLYLTLNAEFVAIVNIIVYAGAIMVLFLFVIFLINPTREETSDRLGSQRVWGIGLGLFLLVEAAVIVLRAGETNLNVVPPPLALPEGMTNIEAIGAQLFTQYLFPFEAVSLILLAAAVGAIVLAKRSL